MTLGLLKNKYRDGQEILLPEDLEFLNWLLAQLSLAYTGSTNVVKRYQIRRQMSKPSIIHELYS